jgi:hypothetical protein
MRSIAAPDGCVDTRLAVAPGLASERSSDRWPKIGRIACSVAIVFLTQACALTSDDVQTDDVTQAVTADWIHPACQGSALGPPGNDPLYCNGPWAYSYQEWWVNGAACGNSSTCTAYNSCWSWDFYSEGDGLGYSPIWWFEGAVTSGSYTWYAWDGYTEGQFPEDLCLLAANQRRDALLATTPGVHGAALANFNVGWNYSNVHIWPSGNPWGYDYSETTTYDCDLYINSYPYMLYGTHPWCGCAAYAPAECLRGGAVATATAPGAIKPANPGAPSSGSSRREFAVAPSCTTFDQQPSGTDAELRAKFDSFAAALPTATGDLQSSLAARMKLVFQLYGERLTAPQRTSVETLYDNKPDPATACSVPLVWDPACRTEATPLKLPSQLQLCQDLVKNDNASTGIASAEFQHCLDELEKVNQLSTDACRLPTRDVADSAAQGVLTKSYPPFTNDLGVRLPGVFTRVNAWWKAATTAARGDHGWLLGHSNTAVRPLGISL